MITITASNHICSLFISHCDLTRKIQADDFTVEKAEKIKNQHIKTSSSTIFLSNHNVLQSGNWDK